MTWESYHFVLAAWAPYGVLVLAAELLEDTISNAHLANVVFAITNFRLLKMR